MVTPAAPTRPKALVVLIMAPTPCGSTQRNHACLEELPLEPKSLAKLTHRNADLLLKLAVQSWGKSRGVQQQSACCGSKAVR